MSVTAKRVHIARASCFRVAVVRFSMPGCVSMHSVFSHSTPFPFLTPCVFLSPPLFLWVCPGFVCIRIGIHTCTVSDVFGAYFPFFANHMALRLFSRLFSFSSLSIAFCALLHTVTRAITDLLVSSARRASSLAIFVAISRCTCRYLMLHTRTKINFV